MVLNGRFLTRKMTGVDRVATELSMALIETLSSKEDQSVSLSLPRSQIVSRSDRPAQILGLNRVTTLPFRGYFWEQFGLAVLKPSLWVLNLCNLGSIFRSKQVAMIHDAQVYTQPSAYSWSFRAVYSFILPRLARRSQIVLTVSDFSRRELEALGVFPEGKAIVVHNGADHMVSIPNDDSALSKFGLSSGGYFLAIGSLAAHKNLPMLIAAAKARQDTSIPLVIAGGGNSKVFRAQGLTEEHGIRFLGRVSDVELKALYKGACGLVFPSKTEGFGLPPLEAMFCGCPVIATTGGAVPEVCGDAVLYADPNEPAQWIAAMEMLCSDEHLRADLSQRGRERAAHFTWARAADKILDAILAAESTR